MTKNEKLTDLIRRIKFEEKLTQSEIARKIGVNSQYLSGVINGHYPLSPELENKLYEKFSGVLHSPSINSLSDPIAPYTGSRLRPYYTDIPVSGGDIAQYPDILSQASDGTLYLPELRSAEFFFPVIGCSMRPTVPEGAIVGVAHVDRYETIDPDRIYLIITADNQRMIKHIVHYDSQSETLTLASDNRDYPAFSLPATLIRDIYRVVCTLAVATL